MCIFRYLHLQDNMDPAVDKSDKPWKLKGFMDLLLVRFQDLYEVNGFVTMDESMVKSKGRLAFRQYLPYEAGEVGSKGVGDGGEQDRLWQQFPGVHEGPSG